MELNDNFSKLEMEEYDKEQKLLEGDESEEEKRAKIYRDLEEIAGKNEVLKMMANNEIPRLYWSLEDYNPEVISEELTKLVIKDYSKLIDILINPVENSGDFILLLSFLNTKGKPINEKLRLMTYELVLKYCGEQFERLPELQELLPVSNLATLCNEIMKFYQEYDPFNLKTEKLGWGQLQEHGLTADKRLNYHTANFSPIFRNLHAIVNHKDTPESRLRKANELIDSLRNYMNDPVPDSVYVYFMKPNRNGELILIENAIDDVDGVSFYIEGEKIFKPLGNNILAISQRNAKAKELPKNRTIVKANGDVLGVARGPIMFVAIDEKENFVNMTTEQTTWINKTYFYAQSFNTYPVDTDRAKELLNNIYEIIALRGDDAHRTLRSYGFREQEIENFKKYNEKV